MKVRRSLHFGCGFLLLVGCTDPVKKVQRLVATDSNSVYVDVLESNWNFYLHKKLFLGPTYFGNSTTNGRNGQAMHALQLVSEYPIYRALALKGLIKVDELNPLDAPPAARSGNTIINRAATISLTEQGKKIGTVHNDENTVVFELGNYRIDKVTVSSRLPAEHGEFRFIEGTKSLTINPMMLDVWAELGLPTDRARKFRALLEHDTTSARFHVSGRPWTIAIASNRRFSAEDEGALNSEYTSSNVSETLETFRLLKALADSERKKLSDSVTYHDFIGSFAVIDNGPQVPFSVSQGVRFFVTPVAHVLLDDEELEVLPAQKINDWLLVEAADVVKGIGNETVAFLMVPIGSTYRDHLCQTGLILITSRRVVDVIRLN